MADEDAYGIETAKAISEFLKEQGMDYPIVGEPAGEALPKVLNALQMLKRDRDFYKELAMKLHLNN